MAKGFFYAGHGFFGDLVAERLAPEGYERVTDAGSAKLVVTYCAGIQEHEDAFYDEDGIAGALQPGTLLIDFTPTTPRLARDLAMIAGSAGALKVEAPLVVVDPAAAEPFAKRGLACFVSGEKEAVEAARPVLDLLVGTVYTAGTEPGSACLARTTYTIQMASQIVAMAEAQALVRGVRTQLGAGLSPQGNAGAITPLGTTIQKAIVEERFSNGYTVDMFLAEIAAAEFAAEEAGVVLPCLDSCLQVTELLQLVGGGQKSPAAISLVYVEQEEATSHGLDWSIAERALEGHGGCGHEGCDCDEDCGDDCTCDHGHDRGRKAKAADPFDDDDDDDSPFRDDYDGWGTLRFDDDDDWS